MGSSLLVTSVYCACIRSKQRVNLRNLRVKYKETPVACIVNIRLFELLGFELLYFHCYVRDISCEFIRVGELGNQSNFLTIICRLQTLVSIYTRDSRIIVQITTTVST